MKTELVLGLDIGKNGKAIACALSCFPDNLKRWFLASKNTNAFFPVSPCDESINRIKQLAPTALVLEPTGSHYSAFWGQFAKVHRIPCYWMSHQELRGQRIHFGFSNKTDWIDACCLAASYFDVDFVDRWGQKRFLKHYHETKINQLRELVYEIEQLDAMRNALINQLRQRLSLEFPEASGRAWKRGCKGYTPFLDWLGHQHPSGRYQKLWDGSIAHALGIDLTTYSEDHARAIVSIEERLTRHETTLTQLLTDQDFACYIKVFDEFGFGLTMRSLLLKQVYPFEKFLIEGSPLIEIENGKKRHRSLRSFQAFLGLSRQIKQSGDKRSNRFSGSTICRSHLYAWFLCRIAVNNPAQQLQTPTGQALRTKWEATRRANIKGKDGIIRCLFLATRLMFAQLVTATKTQVL